MPEGPRERGFSWLAELGVRRGGLVLAVAAALLFAAGLAVRGLDVSTSRTGLVSRDDPDQARLFAFYERFGRPDAPLFVLSGGEPADRRGAVDALQAGLEADPQLKGRVLGRIRPRDVAEILLLQEPSAMAQLRTALPGDVDLPQLIGSGLPGWLHALTTQMRRGLDGAEDPDDGEAPEPSAPPVDLEQAASGLQQLARVAEMFDKYLAGGDPLLGVSDAASLSGPALDEAGYLVAGDGEFHLVAVYPELDSDEGRVLEPVVLHLREIRDEALQGPANGVSADLTGLPGLSVDELTIVRTGLGSSSVAATAGIFLLCLMLFRSLRQTIVALIPLLPGIVLTLAAVRLIYEDLNLITSSFVAVLLGLGIDFSVHVIARRNEQIRADAAPDDAVRLSLRRTGPGIMTGALVTAAAFLTTATTDFTAYGELGIITAIGLVLIMLATFFLLPALLRGRARGTVRVAPEPPGLRLVPGLVRRLKFVLIAVGVLGGVAGAFALPRLEFNNRYFDFLPQSTESARGLFKLEYDALASPVFASFTAESMAQARQMAASLRGFDSVAGVQTPSDLLPELTPRRLAELQAGFQGVATDPDFAALAQTELTAEQVAPVLKGLVSTLDEVRFALRGSGPPQEAAAAAREAFKQLDSRVASLDDAGRARLAELHRDLAAILGPAWATARAVAQRGAYAPQDLPPLFATRYVSKDGKALALYAVPSGAFWKPEVAERFSTDARGVDPDVSGLALMHVAHGEMIVAGFRRAALIAAVIIVLLLVLDFRSLRDALLALLPTALGWLWMLGLMAAFGLDFNVANIVALPLVLGIGIAFGVHMMHRCRETTDPSPADSCPVGERGSVDDVVRGTGGAIGVAALTTMVGFAGLIIPDYGGMKSLGMVMVMGIGCCLVATVLVLPAVLLVLRRVR